MYFSPRSRYVYAYTYAYLHIGLLTLTHIITRTRADGWIDRHIRKKQRTKDGRRKTEDRNVRVNRKKQAHALTSTLSTFVPSLLCSKLGHQFMTLKVSVK